MKRSVLDTDMLSEYMRGRNPIVMVHAAQYLIEHGRITLTCISVTETVKGYQQIERPDQVNATIDALEDKEVLPLTLSSAVLAGRIAGDLVRTGQTIGDYDPLIAAIAINSGLTLATGNTRHYQRVINLGYPLDVVNWREPPMD